MCGYSPRKFFVSGSTCLFSLFVCNTGCAGAAAYTGAQPGSLDAGATTTVTVPYAVCIPHPTYSHGLSVNTKSGSGVSIMIYPPVET